MSCFFVLHLRLNSAAFSDTGMMLAVVLPPPTPQLSADYWFGRLTGCSGGTSMEVGGWGGAGIHSSQYHLISLHRGRGVPDLRCVCVWRESGKLTKQWLLCERGPTVTGLFGGGGQGVVRA